MSPACKATRSCLSERILLLSPLLVFLLVWQYAVSDSPRLRFLFASPLAIFKLAVLEYSRAGFWFDLGLTAAEALAGYLLGSVCGIMCGLILWLRPLIERISRPYVICLGSIPLFALALMLIIWFGIGFSAKLMMAAFGVFVVTLDHTLEGFRSTAVEHIQFARQLNASTAAIVRKVLLPSAIRWLLLAARINVGLAIMGAFIAEFISSTVGIGHYIISASQLYDIPKVLFGIFNLTLLALLLCRLIDHLASRFSARQ